jgi:hypothetical protein
MTARSILPKNVVRFYRNVDYALDTIAHRQAIFVHVSKLNDPFDPYFFFETDFGGNYQRLIGWVGDHHPSDIGWFVQHVTADGWQKSVDDIMAFMRDLRNTSYVFSCSAATKESHPKDNLYMWGHYGNGHRGVAIEFDTRKVASLVTQVHNEEKDQQLGPESAWVRIEYETKMPPMTRKMFFDFFRNDYEGGQRHTSLAAFYDKTARVKSLVWKPEAEWRMLWHNDETRLKVHRAPIPSDAVTAVYLGMSMSAGSEADVVFETRRKFPTAKIYKASKKPGFTELEFKQVT